MKVLILGIGGQDGSYLADILLAKSYEVYGLHRRSSLDNLTRIAHIRDKIKLVKGDILDTVNLSHIIETVRPDEIYNEADQDHVGWSYSLPTSAVQITAGAVAGLLETVKNIDKNIKVFQPVSATMFGDAAPKQNESTPFNPLSPYACAKVAAYHLARYYRQVHGMFVSTAILYNHDSPRRKGDYLLQEISRSALNVAAKVQDKILLGNFEMLVDIGYAREYMETVHSIMQLNEPADFIIASNSNITIKELAEYALWKIGYSPVGRIGVNPSFQRPGVQPVLVGDTTKAYNSFGYAPKVTVFDVLNKIMRRDMGLVEE